MNSLLRNPVAHATSRRVLGGNIVAVVRNAGGGPSMAPGSGGIPIPPGPKQMQQLKNWAGTAVTFGAAGLTGLVYFTDWRVITDWIPFYNGKYKDE